MNRAFSPRVLQTALPWLLIIVGLWAYHNSLVGPFIYDDLPAIVDNPRIRHLWPLWEAMSAPDGSPVDGRPMVSLTLAINYALGGLQTWGYHAVNLVIHLLSGIVLYGLLRRTLGGTRLREQFGCDAQWLSGSITVIWMAHPLVTESVNYVIQRSELLMGLWLLLTLNVVTRRAHAASGGRWTVIAVASCAAGMASKEAMIGAPLLALLYDRTFLSASFREALHRRRTLYLGLVATWLVLAICVITSTHERVAGFGFSHVTPWDHAVTQLGVLLHYLRLAVWPHPLVVDYGDWPLATHLSDVWPAAVIIIGLLGWTLWAVARRLPAGFLGAWFFLILGPTSSVLPILTEAVAERRMYLPLAAVVTVIVLGTWRLVRWAVLREAARRFVFAGCVVAVVTICSALTIRRNEDYRTAVRIWSDAAAKRPGNPRAHSNLGFVFLQEGRLDEAIASSREALRLWPDYAEAHNNLGAALARRGALAQAVSHYAEAIRLRPDYPQPHHNFGLACFEQGRVDEAIRHYNDALRLQPDYAEAHNNLGVALARQGALGPALGHYRDAVRVNPDFANAYHNAGVVLAEQGNLPEAVRYYTQAIRLQPDDAETYNSVGVVLVRQGRREEAADYFRRALRLKPDYADARHNLALLSAE